MKTGDKVKFVDAELGAWTGTVTDDSHVSKGVVYVSWFDGGTDTRVRREFVQHIRAIES